MIRLVPLVILVLSVHIFSQPVRIRSAGTGKARVTSGKTSAVIDLSRDVSGCFVLYDRTDPKAGKIDATAFSLIDSVRKNGSLYLVILGTAGGNCNIQGRCGATEDWTLVWLKLNKRLKVLDKKAEVLQSCNYTSVGIESEVREGKTPLALVNGLLRIDFSESPYNDDSEYKYSTLTYRRAEPEKGFIVTSEKRARPKK